MLGGLLLLIINSKYNTMNRFQIQTADIILENIENGKGKIIISDLNNGSWSFFWGAMGDTIENFIKSINSSYFADKLCNNRFEFSAKQTAKEIRRYIREEMSYELPWYKFRESQKELRKQIKKIEKSNSQYEALALIQDLPNSVHSCELSFKENNEFSKILKDIVSCEPWNFLQNDYSEEYRYLKNLHTQIRLFLNSA